MRIRAIAGDQAMLDLVAHFLGLATHDNINGPPTAQARSIAHGVKLQRGPQAPQMSRRQVDPFYAHPKPI